MADCVFRVLDSFMENLKQLLNSQNPLIRDNQLFTQERNKIQSLYLEVGVVRTLMNDLEEKLYEHEGEGKSLRRKIEDVISEAEEKVDSFVYSSVAVKRGKLAFGIPLKLGDLMKEINSVKADMVLVLMNVSNRLVWKQKQKKPAYLPAPPNPLTEADGIVGFDEEELFLLNRLAGDKKYLDIISVVGMPGIGKTTLVKKVYNNPLIAYHFSIRSWITVSQVYEKRSLLLGILNPILSHKVADIQEMNEQELCEKVFRALKCFRYLIVIDDIWDANAWCELRAVFPDDFNGSRVILTSRNKYVVSRSMPGDLIMRLRTDDESWYLLKALVRVSAVKGHHHLRLIEIGRDIAKKCGGLPLAIVVIAGVLCKRGATIYEWTKVCRSVSSLIVQYPNMVMDTVALSYTHLPHHLKSCFLYLGAFPEDYEIPARKLVWLWVAEGFIRPEGERRLEDIAEGYLVDLIDRNLVIVSQRSSNGGVKICCMHDLLRQFCVSKFQKYRVLQQFYGEPVTYENVHRRLFIHSRLLHHILLNRSARYVRSFLSFSCEPNLFQPINTSFDFRKFKLIRILDLESTSISSVPSAIGLLVHLKYLAVFSTTAVSIPSSISNLWNLEILIVNGLPSRSVLPYNIWMMKKLRHIHIDGEAYFPFVRESTDNGNRFVLSNLQTISTVHLSSSNEEVLLRIPNVRKLGCTFEEYGGRAFPNLENLVDLESLKLNALPIISIPVKLSIPVKFPLLYKFPSNLKKLSLAEFCLPWTEISILGKLPNLEVLKLLNNSFMGSYWITGDGEFLRLKFLKFQGLDIEYWKVSSDHFPRLQHLELSRCSKLEEIPYEFADSNTLRMIKLDCSSPAAVKSVTVIQEERMQMGDNSFKIFIQDGPVPLPPLSDSQSWKGLLNPTSCPLPDSSPQPWPRRNQLQLRRRLTTYGGFEMLLETL